MDLTKANNFRWENGVSLSPLKIPKGKALYSVEEVNRLMESYHQSELKKLRVADVSGSLPIKRYDIDFGGNVMAGIEIKGESLNVFGAINGYGDGIDDEKIKITERRQ
jgi:hypothetical protein